jgi:outer membrane protein TolC
MHLKGQHLLLNQALDAQIMITDSTRERYIKGVTFVEDLLKENANQFALSEEIHTLKMQIDQSTRSLEILVGAYPNAEALAYTELPELPESVPAGIPSSLLSNRPDIISAERNLASANVLVKNTQKSRLPQISITGNSGTSSSDLSDLLKSDFSVWSVGSSIVMPLINHGKIKASIKQAKAGRLEAEAYYDSTVLNAFMEVENGLANEAYLKKERALNNQQLQQALSIFEISQSKYINGSADFRMYLNTHLNALKSQRLNLKMKHEQLQNRINLYLALGYSFI